MRWTTAVDLSMGYYHMKLNKDLSGACTILLPWRNYCYNALPMGFCGSTDIFQHTLGTLFADLAHVSVYLDDIIIIGIGSYEEYLAQVEEVLARLLEKGFQVNPLKSFWGKFEVEYLVFVIKREGICLQKKNTRHPTCKRIYFYKTAKKLYWHG